MLGTVHSCYLYVYDLKNLERFCRFVKYKLLLESPSMFQSPPNNCYNGARVI